MREGETPVPIPNTTVKTFTADGTMRATAWESRWLPGNMFAQLAAEMGHEISTLPDFPAEIRAPQGTLGGVSGFQVELGSEVYTPGDKADVIVAMNAAALKVCTLGSHFNHPQAHFDDDFPSLITPSGRLYEPTRTISRSFAVICCPLSIVFLTRTISVF